MRFFYYVYVMQRTIEVGSYPTTRVSRVFWKAVNVICYCISDSRGFYLYFFLPLRDHIFNAILVVVFGGKLRLLAS